MSLYTLYRMRSSVTFQLTILWCVVTFMVFLMFQIWDTKREFRRYVSVSTCIQLLQIGNHKSYKLYGCNTMAVDYDTQSEMEVNNEEVLIGQTNQHARLSKRLQTSTQDNDESQDVKRRNDIIQRQICPKKIQILILISSHCSHLVRRTSIRSTWGVDGSTLLRWNTLFVLAQGTNTTQIIRATEEQNAYRDMIIGDFEEGFYKLTGKVEFGLHWSIKHCQFDYLLKGDDDVFINVPNLISFLKLSSTPKKGLYAGNVHYKAVVRRKGRYGVPKEDYWKAFYPRYCSGGGFVLSVDVVNDLVEKIKRFPDRRRLIIDDAYVGELALEAGVDVYPSADFLMFEKSCTFKPHAIVFHPVKEVECMRELYISSRALKL